MRRFSGVIVQTSLTEAGDNDLREFSESVTYNQAKNMWDFGNTFFCN